MNMISKDTGKFRELSVSEVALVSGGLLDTEAVDPFAVGDTFGGIDPFHINGGGSQIPGIEVWDRDAVDENGDGIDDLDGAIIVNAPPIQDFDPSFGGTFFARLAGDGGYIQYQGILHNYGVWGFEMEYIPIATGTYTVTYNSDSYTVGTGGVTYNSGSSSITFTPTSGI